MSERFRVTETRQLIVAVADWEVIEEDETHESVASEIADSVPQSEWKVLEREVDAL